MFNKKLSLILLLILIASNLYMSSFAENYRCTDNVNCVNHCPQKPYPIANPFSRGIQKISTINFLASKFAEGQVEKQISKYAKGDFDVNIDSYSATDLYDGKLKGMSVNATNVEFMDIYFSTINAKSDCDFISIDYRATPVKLRAPLSVDFNGRVTEDDLNKIINGQKYKSQLAYIRRNNDTFKFVDFINSRAIIKNNRIQIMTDVKMPILPQVMTLTVDSDFKIINNKISLSNTKILTGNMNLDINFPQSFIDMLNPFILNSAGLDSHGRKITLQKVNVNNNQIEIAGNLWLSKSK
ncbi:MAG: LmeA family phospholipid-binding protein [Candidatus Gastranaerophilaceae bacterium]|jgi:hypothetical protein